MERYADFMWTCPKCGHDQTERVTIDGPVMSLICESCTHDFDARDLPREIVKAWDAAIEDVVPRG